ncbi:hypothetical protein [uncultured Roseobacter sp.]|uniref:hypothetical protein n=1 Tax=uncultured Roseobacter sp. TaxID=114847 RepID=UPI00261D96EE|nr:hypothetical protein [uncultured Roseobacter sp.]
MTSTPKKSHVNFHIGAPRIADDLIGQAAATPAVRSDTQVRLIRVGEYKKHLRHLVNAGPLSMEDFAFETEGSAAFWKDLRDHRIVVASQHALMGHPKRVLRHGVILPHAERRIAKLCALFNGHSMDLHLGITDQARYLLQLPAGNRDGDGGRLDFSERVPSWFDLAARIRESCPNNRIIVWDFSEPDAVALPFVMTLLGVEEDQLDVMKVAVADHVRHQSVLSKLFPRETLTPDVQVLLRRQFEHDLQNLETLQDTIVIRADEVPDELRVGSDAQGQSVDPKT